MPVMDGLEASEKIFALNTGIPIVAMTANIMINDLEIYRKSGLHDCVGKPFTSQELWRCLLKYFKPINWQEVNETQQAQAENELQQKLINNFVKDNRNKFKEIKEAIDSGDAKLAHRLAHTLKGNAGQLGKTILQKASADIERRLKEGMPSSSKGHNAGDARFPSARDLVTEEQLEILEAELNSVLVEFAPLVSEPVASSKAEGEGESFEAESVGGLFEKLKTMLEMGNPECRELAGSLRLIPKSEELIQKMEDLDFEPALEMLAELKRKLEI